MNIYAITRTALHDIRDMYYNINPTDKEIEAIAKAASVDRTVIMNADKARPEVFVDVLHRFIMGQLR